MTGVAAGGLLLAALTVAGCSSTAPDVSGVAGSPAPTPSPSAALQPADATEVATAPACRGFPESPDGLPCLGPGQPVDWRALRGPTVVSVWASWCEPCREELPVLQQYADQGGSVLGIAVASEPEAAAALLADLGVTFPSVQDPPSSSRGQLGWVGPPANYVVVGGRVTHRFDAAVTSVDQVTDAVAAGLAQAGG